MKHYFPFLIRKMNKSCWSTFFLTCLFLSNVIVLILSVLLLYFISENQNQAAIINVGVLMLFLIVNIGNLTIYFFINRVNPTNPDLMLVF
jgi:hypothetical protein